jgi:hypothetical protein
MAKRFLLTAFVVTSICVSLGIVELTFRILETPFRPTNKPAFGVIAQYDKDLGWSYIPNQTTVETVGDPPRSVFFHTNDIGARVGSAGQSAERKAPSALFVGGSFTRGQGVAFEDTFVGILAANPQLPFQVMNLGVDAYGTDQSYLMLKRHFEQFDVRVVVYTFLANHMARNAVEDWRLLAPEGRFPGTKPRFALGTDGKLRLADTPRRYDTFDYSRVYALLRMLWLHQGPRLSPELSIAIVREMQRFVESRGARFILVHWDQWDEGRRTWDADTSPFRGVVHPLIETTRDAPPGWETWVIPGDDHPDERAHRRVASLLDKEFDRLGLLESR